jgi:hypothetical protein
MYLSPTMLFSLGVALRTADHGTAKTSRDKVNSGDSH